jgi:hypothetical protein
MNTIYPWMGCTEHKEQHEAGKTLKIVRVHDSSLNYLCNFQHCNFKNKKHLTRFQHKNIKSKNSIRRSIKLKKCVRKKNVSQPVIPKFQLTAHTLTDHHIEWKNVVPKMRNKKMMSALATSIQHSTMSSSLRKEV